MNRAVDYVAAGAAQVDGFHDVDLAGGGPCAIHVVLRQHPERRPQALASGQLDARLDSAIAKGEAIAGVDAGRGVVLAAGVFFLCRDDQAAVHELGVIRQVPLELVIAPAGDTVLRTIAGLEEPGLGVELRRVELIAPDQREVVAGRHGLVVLDQERRVTDVLVAGRRWRRCRLWFRLWLRSWRGRRLDGLGGRCFGLGRRAVSTAAAGGQDGHERGPQ